MVTISSALPPLMEVLLAELLASGQYRRWVDRLRPKLAATRAQAVARLQALGFGLAAEGEPGLFLWAALPPGCEPEAVYQAALDRGLLLARGSLFRPERGGSRHLRFNAARSSEPRMFEALEAALAARGADTG
ncbi:aminotransferase class I/II-fold pyridoxal phosphate-dependent enzyme [Belnapia moabensis]|uniref:aminotransferase class I/II-fold pyridoxal phosphate-dependent enzyme n=1 Tax=Belnapia moabensis TaxID=365533 RepID=UPI0012EE5557|nr:aminotransferase class I/II-fold pyridoxal phosphate-dependent enzyme [Belnapia moabensis]